MKKKFTDGGTNGRTDKMTYLKYESSNQEFYVGADFRSM